MTLPRQKYFSEETWATKKPRTFLGWLLGRSDFAENNRILAYNKETGRKWWKPMWRFGPRWRDFKNWQQEKYGNVVYRGIL